MQAEYANNEWELGQKQKYGQALLHPFSLSATCKNQHVVYTKAESQYTPDP